ncbi:hypothetical protein [Sphingomonas sp.]|uniref:hypothetical protein n=1 Tax=Sphingomonas sp. TaxID=28214 RepID=UPI0017A066CF|nr:hypothetical protein [Sphingomonas sp.]MBA3511086.1 hypothetical protein [Sphingomonas sp.]
MASPLQTAKPTVNLASNLASAGPRVSRIRRDPPPPVKEKVVVDFEERDQWVVIVGVLAFALAIFVVILAFGSYSSWSPREYKVEMTIAE